MLWKTKAAATLALNNHLKGHISTSHFILDEMKITEERYKEIMKEKFPSTKDYREWLIDRNLVIIKELK